MDKVFTYSLRNGLIEIRAFVSGGLFILIDRSLHWNLATCFLLTYFFLLSFFLLSFSVPIDSAFASSSVAITLACSAPSLSCEHRSSMLLLGRRVG